MPGGKRKFRLTGNYGTFVIDRVVEAEDEEDAFTETGIMDDLADQGWRIVSAPDGEEWEVAEIGEPPYMPTFDPSSPDNPFPARASSLPSRGAVPNLPPGVTVNDDGDDDEHARLEVTVGVMVTFKRQPDGRYVADPEMVTTNGGLFSDAEEGPWCPECSEWVDGPDNVMGRAESLVIAALRGARTGDG